MRAQERTRKAKRRETHTVGALRGRRNEQAAPNSMKFLANVEGEHVDGHVRGANGIRWRVA